MTVFCGIDPGFSGGIAFLNDKPQSSPIIYKMPVIKEIRVVDGKKSIKQSYDLLAIKELFEKHLTKDSIFILEKVGPHRGEGTVSSFNFGRGFGNLEGLIVGLFGKLAIKVTPQRWKKYFPELVTNLIIEKKQEVKELRVIGKTLKDKEVKKQNKKDIDKLNRQIKNEAKTASRGLISSRYPASADMFVKKNTDGMAESVLIAIYGMDHINELV